VAPPTHIIGDWTPSEELLAFLDVHQIDRLRKVAVDLSIDATEQFVTILKQPDTVVNRYALAQQFKLDKEGWEKVADLARRHLLADPALAADGRKLTQRVQVDLKGGKAAGEYTEFLRDQIRQKAEKQAVDRLAQRYMQATLHSLVLDTGTGTDHTKKVPRDSLPYLFNRQFADAVEASGEEETVVPLAMLRTAAQREFNAGLWSTIRSKWRAFAAAMRQEAKETRELGSVLGKALTGQEVSAAEYRAAKEQAKDIFKMLAAGGMMAVPVPGASAIIPALTAAVNKVFGQSYDWRPSSFKTAGGKFKNKKTVKNQKGEDQVVYEYSERQVANRHREKAERIEKLRGNLHKLVAQVKKDLKSKDPHTRLCALAVGLMNDTYERVGNEESAKDGHVGVTGWTPEHVKFSGSKATFSYVGKSGVKQTKETSDAGLVAALKEAVKDKQKGDTLFVYDDGKVDASAVNEYLKPFDITAKDIRGLHANKEMQTRLKAIRSKGGDLPEDKKERGKKLKDEFKKALEEAAEAVGHEPSTLKSQYLVPGIEDNYLRDGSVVTKLDKQGSLKTYYRIQPNLVDPSAVTELEAAGYLEKKDDLHMAVSPMFFVKRKLYEASVRRLAARWFVEGTKTPAEKEDEEVERLNRRNPTKKPPRHDLRRNRMEEDDPDIEGFGADSDRDLSQNYKKRAALAVTQVAVRYLMAAKNKQKERERQKKQQKRQLQKRTERKDKAQNPPPPAPSPPAEPPKKHEPGDTWQVADGPSKGAWVGMNDKNVTHTFGTDDKAKAQAEAFAKGQSPDEAKDTADQAAKDQEQQKKKQKKSERVQLRNDLVNLVGSLEKSGDLSEDLAQELMERADTPEFFDAYKAEMKAMRVQLGEHGITSEMMKDMAKDPFRDLDTTDPEEVARAFIEAKVQEALLLDPSNVGGQPLSADPLDDAQMVKRAKAAMTQFRHASAKQRKTIAQKAAAQLADLEPGSPEANELNKIIDGLQMAFILNGEKFEVKNAAGQLLREPLSTRMLPIAKELVKKGKADMLFTADSSQMYQAEGRGMVRDILGEMDDTKLAEVSQDSPWQALTDVLVEKGKDLAPDVAEYLRSMVRDMMVGSMTTIQGVAANLTREKKDAATNEDAYAQAREELEKAAKDDVDAACSSFLTECIISGKPSAECMGGEAPKAIQRTFYKKVWDIITRRKDKIDPQDTATAVTRAVAEGADPAIADDPTLQPERPLEERKRDFLEGVTDPAERKRIEEMTPEEFSAMEKAILDGGEGKLVA